jgi:alkyldihydroxyacetonephosphate synthase
MPPRFRPCVTLGSDLLAILPPERVSQSSADRLIYSRDMWPKALLSVRDGKPQVSPPDFIVWPESTEEVAAIVRLARSREVPVVPWGGGSGVCGGAMATHGGIILDLKRMNRILSVSPMDHLATLECGIIGQTVEDQLNLRALTLGHFPASIYCSTLGGWLAARSAGQLSSRYGKIEDMVQAMEVVLGDGSVISCSPSHEPNLIPLIVGSEGTLGVITQATMRVHPLPEHRIFRAYEFPRIAAGCEAFRRVMQLGLRPAVMRLYDEMDSLLARASGQGRRAPRESGGTRPEPALGSRESFDAEIKQLLVKSALLRAGMLSRLAERLLPRLTAGCLAILGFEGEPQLVEAEAAICHSQFLSLGAKDLGEGPGLSWYQRRYAISYKMSPLYVSGGFVDTLEVATTWDRLLNLYAEVRRALAPLAFVLAHFSHAYPEGCSIYFTFAVAAEGRSKADNLFDEIWRRGLSAVLKAGGTISHHHGVGLSKAAFMAEEHGTGLAIYRQLKTVMDPDGILNPGKMGL